MQQATRQKLELFTKLNNWQMPHPLDIERFCDFIVEAYNNGDTEIARDKFLEVVNPFYKMDEDELDKWTKRFENGIELLKVKDKNKEQGIIKSKWTNDGVVELFGFKDDFGVINYSVVKVIHGENVVSGACNPEEIKFGNDKNAALNFFDNQI